MVRINLIKPRYLTDQHLIAEYLEILMFFNYVIKHPDQEDIPKKFCLGKGHMKFFKDKLKYLGDRHEKIKKEMQRRGFEARKKISLKNYPKMMVRDWSPSDKDLEIIKKRLIKKINLKPKFYRYYRKHKTKKFLIELIEKAT